MANKLHYFIGLLALVVACGEDLEREVVSTYPDKSPQVVHYFKWIGNGKEVKKEVRYFRNGEKELEGPIKSGEKHGIWTQWYPSGEKWTETKYKKGKRYGKMIEWYKSGEVNYIAHYKNDVPHGEWIFYDGEGNKVKKVVYENGEQVKEKNLQD